MSHNISQAIGHKFNHQQGMSCKEIDGVLTIVAFLGADPDPAKNIPSQEDQDRWMAEYDDWVSGGGLEEQTARGSIKNNEAFDSFMLSIYELFNKIRVLEGKVEVTGSFKQD